MRRRAMVVHLTAKERVLLHLLDYVKHAEAVEVPPEMTQEGIARAASFDLAHFSEYVRPLVKDGALRERMAHVMGSRQRRKVYDLTDAGRMAAVRLRDPLKTEVVRVRDSGGVREAPASQVVQELAGKAPLLRVLRDAAVEGIVDVAAITAHKPAQFVEMLRDMPKVDRFVGRGNELEVIIGEGVSPRIFVVRGVAGIGKTSLASKACELMRGKRNLCWRVVRPWDTSVSLLAAMGEFLAAAGKPGLRAVLQRDSGGKAPEVLREDLGGTHSFLVFDDVHEVSAEAQAFFRMLAEAVAQAPDARVLILTRESPRFYGRRDVVLRGIVKELDLAGLAPEEVSAYLAADSESAAVIPRSSRYLGLPLFLELVRAHGAVPSGALRDVRHFLEEEVYAKLSDPERRMMKAAVLYRVPVPEVALFADPDSGPDVLLSLVHRSLVRPVGEDRYEVHDTVRDFFAGLASPSEHQRFRSFARDQLCRLAAEASEDRRFAACAECLSNALVLADSSGDRVSLLEALGEATVHQGDILGALVAFREAARTTAEAEARARMHRRAALALLHRDEIAAASEEVEGGLRALGDRRGLELGWLELARCRVLYQGGDTEGAWVHAQTALEVFREAADDEGLAHAHFQLADMGRLGVRKDQVGLVEDHLKAASEHVDPRNDPFLLANIHFAWAGSLAQQKGDFDDADRHIVAVESIPGALEDYQVRRRFLQVRGFLAVQKGDLSAARADYTEVLRFSEEVRDRGAVADANYWLASISAEEGKLSEARTLVAQTADEYEKLGDGTQYNALYWGGAFSLMEGNLTEFRRFLALLRNPKLPRPSGDWQLYANLLEALDCLVRGNGERSLGFLVEPERAVEALPRESWAAAILSSKVYTCLFAALRTLGRDAESEDYRRRVAALARSQRQYAVWESNAVRIMEGIQRAKESAGNPQGPHARRGWDRRIA